MLVTVRNYYTDLNRKMALKDSFKLSICASNSIMGKQSTKNIKKKKLAWKRVWRQKLS